MSLFVLFAFVFFHGCDKKGKTYELVLLHTNDHHGVILPNNGQGGLAQRASFVKSVREANANVLLVDAGDINTGTALSNMFAAEADIQAYNIMGYDAATFGNHEFDGDQAKLDRQIQLAAFPFVSSNIKTADGQFLGGHQYLIKNYEGLRVGVLGITTLRTLHIASPDKGLNFLPEIAAATDAVSLLRNKEKAGIVIALTHMGDRKESPDHITSLDLAAAVAGIDIIVDGHSHSKYAQPKRVGDTWIVSAYEWGKIAGKGLLSIVNGKLVNFEWEAVEIGDGSGYQPDPAIMAMLQPYMAQAEASLKEVVGEAAAAFPFGNRETRYHETALGNMICDANVWYFKTVYNQAVDFAFHNGGNMRAALPHGPITREQILTILPFENYLFIVSLSGSQLIELFDFIATIPQGNGGFPQFSSEVRYTLDAPGKTINGLTIGGAAIEPDKQYRFCTNDYLLGGGDGYAVLIGAAEPFNTSLLLSYVVIEYIRSHGIVAPHLDRRMVVVGGVMPY
ncbi:MAG: 5'-nucleotidase C-terminal domain-containing protein [Treponema sp.]|nr:5'-nucleotidase C-terminal domain-containing protein [Treponema sp.]